MNGQLTRRVCRMIPALVLVLAGEGAIAQDHKTIDGVTIYLGVTPASAIAAVERAMHGGVSQAPRQYHVMVALFDSSSGQRITDAVVHARVFNEYGISRQELLEPMSVADSMTYGNYFTMPDAGNYKVVLDINRPGAPGVVKARLEYKL